MGGFERETEKTADRNSERQYRPVPHLDNGFVEREQPWRFICPRCTAHVQTATGVAGDWYRCSRCEDIYRRAELVDKRDRETQPGPRDGTNDVFSHSDEVRVAGYRVTTSSLGDSICWCPACFEVAPCEADDRLCRVIRGTPGQYGHSKSESPQVGERIQTETDETDQASESHLGEAERDGSRDLLCCQCGRDIGHQNAVARSSPTPRVSPDGGYYPPLSIVGALLSHLHSSVPVTFVRCGAHVTGKNYHERGLEKTELSAAPETTTEYQEKLPADYRQPALQFTVPAPGAEHLPGALTEATGTTETLSTTIRRSCAGLGLTTSLCSGTTQVSSEAVLELYAQPTDPDTVAEPVRNQLSVPWNG